MGHKLYANLFEFFKNFKITFFHLENGEKQNKTMATAAVIQYQCPAFGTVLICIETVPKGGHQGWEFAHSLIAHWLKSLRTNEQM